MSQPLIPTEEEGIEVNIDHLVTEDDTPVDNLFSEKQQRLLTEPLYSSWAGPVGESGERRRFLAAAHVGMFPAVHQPPLVPDVFLSLDVQVAKNWYEKRHRSYFFWEFGKAPEVVIEVVSNREGNELGSKLRDYARAGVPYYAVYDPTGQLGEQPLRVFELRGRQYGKRAAGYLSDVGLGLRLWDGEYEGQRAVWLRWCDEQGEVIPTGAERAAREAERAEREADRAAREAERAAHETERATREAERAAREAERADRLAARLREMGVDPNHE